MVLGLKKKKGLSVQVDYIVSVLEIKPWPPSIPLCSVQTVLIQWENGEHNSGFLPPGVPALNGFEDGKIEFNEFFKLQVTLSISNKNKTTGPDKFQKNYLEFNLYEPRKEKAAKGQLLGTASVNLAQYGIIRDMEMITVPIHIKKMSKGMTQTFLYLKIQPFDQEGIESVLKLMSEQCEEDCDLVSFTDDEEGASASVQTLSEQDIAPFKMDEVLNFVSMGLNSEATTPRVVQRQESYAKDDVKGKRQIKSSPSRSLTGARHETQNGGFKEEDHTQRVSHEEEDPSLIRSSSVSDRDVFTKFSDFATKTKSASRSNTYKFGRKTSVLLKNNKSVRYPSESSKFNIDRLSSFHTESSRESTSSTKSAITDVDTTEKKSNKKSSGGSNNDDRNKAAGLESKIQTLEEELREAAALEVSLYSVAAEHVNSKRKVHAPARRVSRFYRHACTAGSVAMRASVARTTVSGLAVVSKASGNDVSRLTFWLSNTIMLRASVSHITKELPPPVAVAESLDSINVENIQIAPASSEANWMPQGIGGRSDVRYRLQRFAGANGWG